MARTGCTAVGARDFLIAVNYNLNTTSTRRANAIAFDVREKGLPMREGGSLTGKILRYENGSPIMQPGTLKATKAIGWFIDEYGIAQVSMNMTNINVTPLHKAFDEVCRAAAERGVRVTGTEIVGLIPKRVLIEAGEYFLRKQQRSTGIPEEDIIKIAIHSMGLEDLKPFNPREKVIEYLLEDENKTAKLVDLTVSEFANETSRESPAPGGGTIAAYMGALGAALGTMVANLSAHKRGWDERWEEFSQWADRGQDIVRRALHLVDEDTEAFNRIMDAFGLPKGTEEEKAKVTIDNSTTAEGFVADERGHVTGLKVVSVAPGENGPFTRQPRLCQRRRSRRTRRPLSSARRMAQRPHQRCFSQGPCHCRRHPGRGQGDGRERTAAGEGDPRHRRYEDRGIRHHTEALWPKDAKGLSPLNRK